MKITMRWVLLALPAAVVGLGLVACGGGGDDTGSDEEYVTAFCNARREFSTNYNSAVREVAAAGGRNFDLIADAYGSMADAFDDMKPPEDLKDWHDDASDQLSETAKRVRDEQTLEAVTSLERDPLAGMPEEPRRRLRQVANNEPACTGLNVFEG